jgi:hypothetical protein
MAVVPNAKKNLSEKPEYKDRGGGLQTFALILLFSSPPLFSSPLLPPSLPPSFTAGPQYLYSETSSKLVGTADAAAIDNKFVLAKAKKQVGKCEDGAHVEKTGCCPVVKIGSTIESQNQGKYN